MEAGWRKQQNGEPRRWQRPATWLAAVAIVSLPFAGWWLYSTYGQSAPSTAAAESPQTEAAAISPANELPASEHVYDAFIDRQLARQESKPSFIIPPPPYIEHVVTEGDNIWLIALEYGTDMESIAAINDIGVADVLQPGQVLRVLVGTEGIIHTVEEGDTVESLAERFDIRVDAILAANSLRSDKLTVGQELVLPGARLPQRRTATVAAVSRGDGAGSGSAGTDSGHVVPGLIWPHYGLITSYFGWRDGGFHTGIDIDGHTGDPIVAAQSGTVTHSGWGWSGFGIYVVIDHHDGTKTIYAHLSEAYVEAGEEVSQGDVIGALGSTGWSTGPHLHFEILVNGAEIDPLPSLP